MSEAQQGSAAEQVSIFHLAPHQERALVLAGMPPGEAAAKTVRLTLQCSAEVPSDALLQERWSRILRRHEALRTDYRLQPGRAIPFQCVMDGAARAVRILGAGGAGKTIELDLPWLSLDVHSIHLLFAELLGTASFHSAPLGFADVSEWLRGLEDADDADEARRYWQQISLDGAKSACLPWLRESEAVAASRLEVAGRLLGTQRTAAVRSLCRTLAVEEADFHLAMLTLVCAHLGGRTHQVLGVEHNGRSDPELQPVVGMLARVLPVALHIDLQAGGSAWIREVAAQRAAHGAWAEYFNENMLPEAKRAVALPLHFAFDDLTDPAFAAIAAADIRCDWQPEPARLRLRAQALVAESRLHLQWPGNGLTALEAEHLLDVLVATIDSVVAAADRPLSQLGAAIASMGGKLTRVRLDDSESQSTVPLLPARLAQWAQHAPASPAIGDGRASWSYAALHQKSLQAASVLQALGVRRGDRVALLGGRSLQQLAACHAVWAAGAAFVVIDADLPDFRRDLLLRDSGARLVVTPQAPLSIAGVPTLDLERLFEDAAAAGSLPECHPLDTAYLVYTSGTTGHPKAVMVSHGALASYVAGIDAVLGAVRGAAGGLSMGCLSSMSADLGYTTYFGALARGDCAEIVDEHLLRDPMTLAEHLAERRFDVLKIVPSLLRALLAELDTDACRHLLPSRALLLGGERSDPELLRRIDALANTLRVINHYGPSETTVGVLTSVLSPDQPIVVGTPLQGTRVEVLDDDLRPVPVGFAGQLFVTGAQLASGYLGRPAQTAVAFRPGSSGRRYATGDRVRQHPGGSIEFIGRIDDQVKIRGHRVEPAEVETVLRRLPGIKAAACSVVHRDGRGQLAAHVSSSETQLDIAALRAQLQAYLPEHMIPSLWCQVDAIPLLENGKIDRRSLPPADAHGRSTSNHVAPRNAAEQALCEIMCSLLRVEQLSVHDNFFELGGDSIIAIQIAARARRAGLRFNADQLFAHPTVAQLAAVATPTSLAAAEQGIVTGQAPLVPIQARYFERHGGHGVYNHGRAFIPGEGVDEAGLRRALATLCNQHDALRSRFELADGRWHQVVGPAIAESEVSLAIEAVPATLQGADLERWIEQAYDRAQQQVDPLGGPMLHALWLRDAEVERSRLLIAVHHLVVDVVSWNILLEDLLACDPRSPGPYTLPEKSSAFLSWSRALTSHADSASVRGELDFWLRMAQAPVELPLDRSLHDGANTHSAVGTVSFALDSADTRKFLRLQPSSHRDAAAEMLLTALASALQAWAGRDLVSIEMESHGREPLFDEVDHVRTVGWFTSRYPLAIDLTGAGDAAARLARVAAVHAEVPNRGLGYGLLRYLSTDPATCALRELPCPQVSLNYVGQMHSQAGTPGSWLIPAGSAGRERGSLVEREHLLTWIAGVFDGCLHVRCQYSENLHDHSTIAQVADAMRVGLLALLDHAGGNGQPVDDALAGFSGPAEKQQWMDRYLAASAGRVLSIYPLSPLQHGMLFHSVAAPGSGAYLLQMVAELGGGTDATALREAWQDVVAAHPVLRTGFAGLGSGTPLQFVLAEVALPWVEHDWSKLDEQTYRQRLSKFLKDDRGRDFAIEQAPLMRVALIRQPGGAMTMVWTRHHAIVDGWSSSMLMGDLVAAYARRSAAVNVVLEVRPGFDTYIAWLHKQGADDGEAAFWQGYLAGARLPTVLTRAGESDTAAEFSIDLQAALDSDTSRRLRELARSARTTFNVLAQAAWGKVLARASCDDDVAFGAVVSGRPAELPEVEKMVGPFINTQVVRVPAGLEWPQLLAHMHASQVERERFAHTPPTTVRRFAGLAGDNELFQSLFLFQNYAVDEDGYSSPDNPLPLLAVQSHDKTNYPFTLYVSPKGEVRLRLSCDPARVSRQRAQAMLDSYVTALTCIAVHGGWPSEPPAMAIDPIRPANADAAPRDHWLVAGSFNVEPLVPVLEHFGRLFGHGARCDLAPHGQVVQILLDPVHQARSTHAQPILLCLRWQDWLGEGDEQRRQTQVVGAASALCTALERFSEHSSAPVLIVVCPSSPQLQGDQPALFAELDAALAKTVARLPAAACLTLNDVQACWDLKDLHDPHSDLIAHLPYTPQAYAVIAAEVFRRHHARSRAPFKVLVLDCDNTLWGGVCGEVGVDGVCIDGPYESVRKVALAAKANGMLLAIASRNNEADVRNVFQNRALGLQMSDFACWRIDWRAKSLGIAEMAEELNLGLDSFVFLDDDPVQVLEVSSALPDVLALCLPGDASEIPRFLEHVWALDQFGRPAADQDRTALYEQSRHRELARAEAGSLADFIEGLAVQASFAPIDSSHLVRLADLAQRTNQFNLTLHRHTEAELAQRLAQGRLEGAVVQVRDRFGDYGLVGAVLFTSDSGRLHVSDWWLSCRALGRGVEYTMLQWLATRALERGLTEVVLAFAAGPRNIPALEFLRCVEKQAEGAVLAEVALHGRADQLRAVTVPTIQPATPTPVARGAAILAPRPVQAYREVATRLRNAESIVREVAAQADRSGVRRAEYTAPRGQSEQLIARLMGELLGIADVGAEDNFFAMGGHSLMAVRLVAQIAEASGVQMALHTVLESPKVSDLALRLDLLDSQLGVADDETYELMEI